MALTLVFNPFTGQFDYVNDTSAPVTTKYVDTFNSTSSWTLVGSEYHRVIPAATHALGTSPTVAVFELSGSDYLFVSTSIDVNASGDVTIIVNATPDLRFAGKAVLI